MTELDGMMKQLESLKTTLKDYHAKYRHPNLSALEPSGVYALFPDAGNLPADKRWPDYYPNSDAKGVYLIYGGTGKLLYIGKASMSACIGGRLGTYFGGRQECIVRSPHAWNEHPTYVVTVAVAEAFEAPSLEEYLIKTLDPIDNDLGRI